MVGEMPVERSAQLILLLYLDKRGRPEVRIHGQTKVGPEEKFPPLGCGAQHEHQAPTQSEAHQLGTARWACVRAGKCLSDAEATFHRASCTLGNQVVRVSDGSPFRQERRPTRVCRTPGARSRSCSPKRALCEL